MFRRRKDREAPRAQGRASAPPNDAEPQPADGDGHNPYHDLRSQALDAVARGLAPPAELHPDVWGAVIDIARDGDWATIVALGDGTTSLYTSVGGGTIGAGAHTAVAEATEQLLTIIQLRVLPHLDPEEGAHPPPGYVRVHVLRSDGLHGIDIADEVFWGEQGGGGSFVDAMQYLIHCISTVDEAAAGVADGDPGS